jgi:hypothetical protein
VQTISKKGFQRLAGDAESLAKSEGLQAHSDAVTIRRPAFVGARLAPPALAMPKPAQASTLKKSLNKGRP